MDTATHIVMGIGLTALATQDPAMSGSFAATATTLIAGSLIPDSDTVLKLKDNATYIANHRGITHSIPFTILWPLLISLVIFTFFNNVDITHVWMWAQLAVFLHVFVDIFNFTNFPTRSFYSYKLDVFSFADRRARCFYISKVISIMI